MEAWLQHPFYFGETILNELHIFAGPWLDYVMTAITHTGGQIFYMVILAILYWVCDRKMMIKVGGIFLVSALVNTLVKDLYGAPRPDPALLSEGINHLARDLAPHSPGFPSGHTQGSVTFWGSLFWYGNRRKLAIPVLLLIVLVPYSRIYLGVHFLGDVIGGFVIGFAILFAGIFIIRLCQGLTEVQALGLAGAAIIIASIVFFITSETPYVHRITGALAGMMGGIFFMRDKNAPWRSNAVVKVLIGLVGMALIKEGLKFILPAGSGGAYLRYFAIGLWVTLGAPLLFHRFWPETQEASRSDSSLSE